MLGIMLRKHCLRRESPLRWAFLLRVATTTCWGWIGQSVTLTLCPFCYALIQSIIQTSAFVKGELVVSDALALGQSVTLTQCLGHILDFSHFIDYNICMSLGMVCPEFTDKVSW